MNKLQSAILCAFLFLAFTPLSIGQVLQSIESETDGSYLPANDCFNILKTEIQLYDYINGFEIPPGMSVGFIIENGAELYTGLNTGMFDPITGLATAEVIITEYDFNEDCIDNFFEVNITVNLFWNTPMGRIPVDFCTDFVNRPNPFTAPNGPCDVSYTQKLGFCCE